MPVSTASEIVVLKMPDLATDPRIDDFISLSAFYVSESIFSEKYQYALALVALHMFMLDKQSGGNSTSSGSGAMGGIKSEKEGDLSRSFGGMSGNVSQTKIYFSSTPYGLELLQLWNACILMPRTRFVSGR